MYERFFGLTLKPFTLKPDPAFLFPSRQHAMALTLLEYGVESQAAFGLLTGDIGSGKTTLLRRVIRDLENRVSVGLVSNTHSGFQSIVPWLLSSLSVQSDGGSDVARHETLVSHVIRQYAEGKRTVFIIDEAQNLSVAILEELRLLSNVNSERDLVLQIILVGQPELRETLSRPELRQLAQRISVDYHLSPLNAEESAAYIRHRVRAAGCETELFEAEALAAVYQSSAGVPRLINQLCDMALVYAFAEARPTVTLDTVMQVLNDRHRARALPVLQPLAGQPAALVG